MKIKIGGKVYDVDDAKLKDGENLVAEIAVESDDVIRTKEEQTSFESNLKKQHEKAGFEIGIKEFKKHVGIDVTGKDSSAFPAIAEAMKTNTLKEANLSVDEKVRAKDKDIETLKTTITGLEGTVEQSKKDNHSLKRSSAVNSALTKEMPANLLNSVGDTITLMNTHLTFDLNEHGAVVAINPTTGDVMKDSSLNPLSVKDVVKTYFDENPSYLKTTTGGAGGTDSGGAGGKKTMEKFIDEQMALGNPPSSDAFATQLEAEKVAGTIETE